ncbi:ACT domain-containing protein [Agaribacter flavus]|uniref:ACT domain-containing protein n=1 Tax=Agaribacter flavus TaxID=1902781 RepID=A0ABV7FRI9_9ALTE
MKKQTLLVLDDTYSIHRLPANAPIPETVLSAEIFFIGKTKSELSIVCLQSIAVKAQESDKDWRILEVLGPLNLSMLGIMAGISEVLANAEISIFVESTFETDYILVKEKNLDKAIQALSDNGYTLQRK